MYAKREQTGSVNIVRRWEAIASKAKTWNITMLTNWKIGYGQGSRVTKVTTNSAYNINSHVNIAQMIPHMSWKKILKIWHENTNVGL